MAKRDYRRNFSFATAPEARTLSEATQSERIATLRSRGFKGESGEWQTSDLIRASEFNYLFQKIQGEFTTVQGVFDSVWDMIETNALQNTNARQAITNSITALSNKLTAAETKLTTIEAKAVKNETLLNALTTQIRTQAEKIKELENLRRSDKSLIDAATNQVGRIQTLDNRLTASINQMNANFTTLNSSVERLKVVELETESNLNTMKGNITSMLQIQTLLQRESQNSQIDIINLKNKTWMWKLIERNTTSIYPSNTYTTLSLLNMDNVSVVNNTSALGNYTLYMIELEIKYRSSSTAYNTAYVQLFMPGVFYYRQWQNFTFTIHSTYRSTSLVFEVSLMDRGIVLNNVKSLYDGSVYSAESREAYINYTNVFKWLEITS